MTKKKESLKSELIAFRATPEVKEWLYARPEGHTRFMLGLIGDAMAGEGPLAISSNKHKANLRELPLFENFGFLRRHFPDYEAYENFELDFHGSPPDFDPFLDMKLDDMEGNYPEEFTDFTTVDLNQFPIPDTVCAVVEVWQDSDSLGLKKNDRVFVDKSLPVTDGSVAVIWQNNEFYFELVEHKDGIWQISPSHRSFNNKKWEEWKMDFVYGVAVGKYGKIPYSVEAKSSKKAIKLVEKAQKRQKKV